jgi:hypothetical protein
LAGSAELRSLNAVDDSEDIVRRGYDAVSYPHRADAEDPTFYAPRFATLRERAPAGGTVLDLSCGCGVPRLPAGRSPTRQLADQDDTHKHDAEAEPRNLHPPHTVHRCGHQHGRQHDGGRDVVEEAEAMSIGVSIFLLVVGAILTFAVKVSATGFNIDTVGIILMLAGGLGLLLSLLFWSNFSPWSRRRTVRRGDTVIEERRIDPDLP